LVGHFVGAADEVLSCSLGLRHALLITGITGDGRRGRKMGFDRWVGGTSGIPKTPMAARASTGVARRISMRAAARVWPSL
jgi:hypothetical protein